MKKISTALYCVVNFIFTVLGIKFSLQLGNMQHCELLVDIITGRPDPPDAGSPAKEVIECSISNNIRREYSSLRHIPKVCTLAFLNINCILK